MRLHGQAGRAQAYLVMEGKHFNLRHEARELGSCFRRPGLRPSAAGWRTTRGGRQPEQQCALHAVERGGWVEASGCGLLLHPSKLVDIIMNARSIQICRAERRKHSGWARRATCG